MFAYGSILILLGIVVGAAVVTGIAVVAGAAPLPPQEAHTTNTTASRIFLMPGI
jgi:putative Ca2+/H+ antiporter (TMEM165/GDT1 family)